MPTNCIVYGCTRTSGDKTASFYGFPNLNKDPSRRKKWVKFVRSYRKDFTGPGVSHNKRVRICDAHFIENDFVKRYKLAENLRKEGTFSGKFSRQLTDNAVPTKTFISSKSTSTSRNPQRRLSIYCKKSDIRARTQETSLMIAEYQRKKEEESKRKKKEFMEKWEAKTTEDSAKHLQRFALMVKPPVKVSQQKTANQNNRGTQVNIKPPKVCYRSKASMAGSKYWGKNIGMQTEFIQVPRTKDSWTQYEVADTAGDAEVDIEVGPPEEGDGPLEEEDEPTEEEDDVRPEKDDKKKDPDYSPLDELGDARPCRPELNSDMCLGDQDSLESDDSLEYGGDSDEDFEDKPAHKRKKDWSKYRKPAFKFPEACPICSEAWKEKSEIMRHLQTHIPIDKGQEAIKDAVQSIKSKFEKGHNLDMGWCGECKKLLLRFRIHFNRYHTKNPKYSVLCQQCGKMIVQSSYKMHEISHLEIKESDYVQCPQCPSRFKHQEYLKGHINKSHSNKARSVQCSTCGKIFKNPGHLNRHSVIHSGVKPYINTCLICDKSFTQNSNLKIHMRQHTGDKPYVCELCEMAFTNKVSLKNHKKKLHGIDWWKERESLTKEDPERNKSDGSK